MTAGSRAERETPPAVDAAVIASEVPARLLAWRAGHLLAVTLVHAARAVAALLGRVLAGRGRHAATGVCSERVAGLLLALGPTFIKGGQILSTRRDLVGGAWCRALERLNDRVPPPRRAEVAATLRQAYGGQERDLLGDVAAEPLASGSIAAVYRAVLPDGRTAAVKVRRAGITERMHADVALLRGAARLLGHLPPLRGVPVDEMVRQVGAAVLGQLDFDAERRSLAALASNLGDLESVRVPAPWDELCRPETVVMELVEGLRRFDAGALDEDRRRLAATRVLLAVYHMLFVDGLVHCDLHPGNLYLTGDGGVVILDGGFVVGLPDHVRRLFASFFVNMALGRGERCADIVIQSASAAAGDCDLAGFREAMTALVDGTTGARARDFNLADFAAKLFDLQRRHGLYAAPEFAFPLMSLLVLEGMVNELDADVDFQSLALQVILATSR